MKKGDLYKSQEFIDYLIKERTIGADSAQSYENYVRGMIKYFNLGDTFNQDVARGEWSLSYLNNLHEKLCRKSVDSKSINHWKTGLSAYAKFIDHLNMDQLDDVTFTDNEEPIQIEIESEYYFSKSDLEGNFNFRITTQERLSGDLIFPIRLIKQLFYKSSKEDREYFDNWLFNVVANIELKTSNKTFKLKDINGISIVNSKENKDTVNYINYKDSNLPLCSMTAEGTIVNMKCNTLKGIVIDHIKPMKLVLLENASRLSGLKELTDKIKPHISSLTGKEAIKAAAARGRVILPALLSDHTIIEKLKNDLTLIGSMPIQLMDSKENSKKRAKY